jgi:hypothetical protein
VDAKYDRAATILGIALRAMLLFSVPNLSDDVYRFVWDGNLLQSGINPFDHLPSYYVDNQIFIKGNTLELYQLLNSKQYFTIYPPLCQAIFGLSGLLSFHSLSVNIFIIKIFLFAAECGTLFGLSRLVKYTRFPNINQRAVVLYALNPLALIEVCGNIHFEGLMICFLMAGIYFYSQCLENNFNYKSLIYSSLCVSFSICAKLLPLMFLPLFFIKSKSFSWNQHILKTYFKPFLLCFLACLFTIVLYLPFINATFFGNLAQSVSLYFGKFEFNASLYYIFRAIGVWIYGYNPINTVSNTLSLALIAVIFYTAFAKKISFPKGLLYVSMAYLLCATTVHPWYVLLPFVLSLLTNTRLPLLWSLLVFVSYSHYWNGGFSEKYGLIAFEYTALFSFLIFFYKKELINE